MTRPTLVGPLAVLHPLQPLHHYPQALAGLEVVAHQAAVGQEVGLGVELERVTPCLSRLFPILMALTVVKPKKVAANRAPVAAVVAAVVQAPLAVTVIELGF